MTQYIDKSALIAEINRQHKILIQTDHTYGAQFVLGFRQACRQIIDFLDTLEVKDVDLSWKDIRLIAEIGEEFMNSEESDAYADDEEAYYTAILNKLKEKGLNYRTQRQRIRDIQSQKCIILNKDYETNK